MTALTAHPSLIGALVVVAGFLGMCVAAFLEGW